MQKKFFNIILLSLVVTLILVAFLFILFFRRVFIKEILNLSSVGFSIAILINFATSFIIFLLYKDKGFSKLFLVSPFIGNFVFLITIYYLNGKPEDYLKFILLLSLDYIFFLSILEYIFQNSFYSKKFNKPIYTLLSNTFITILLTLIYFIFKDLESLLFVFFIDVLILSFEEFKRFKFSKSNVNIGGRDFLLNTFFTNYENLKKELNDNQTLIDELKNQINTYSSIKKNILSKLAYVKKRILNFITVSGKQDKQYENVYSSISNILSELSTYVLSIEYSVSKLSELISSMSNFFISSYNEVYTTTGKKDEINNLILRNENVTTSLLSKIDTVNEVISQILLTYSNINEDIRLISEEIISLNIISTNAEIESFKLKNQSTISSIVDEISKITKDIKAYNVEIASQYNKLKDLFEYMSSISSSLIKHKDSIKSNFESTKFLLETIVNNFSDYLTKTSNLDSNFSKATELLTAIRSDISKLRGFLGNISELLSLIEDVRHLINEIKQFLEELIIIIEEIESNVSGS